MRIHLPFPRAVTVPPPQVRVWQALTVLTSFVPPAACGQAVTTLMPQVQQNNPPTVKLYQVRCMCLRESAMGKQRGPPCQLQCHTQPSLKAVTLA